MVKDPLVTLFLSHNKTWFCSPSQGKPVYWHERLPCRNLQCLSQVPGTGEWAAQNQIPDGFQGEGFKSSVRECCWVSDQLMHDSWNWLSSILFQASSTFWFKQSSVYILTVINFHLVGICFLENNLGMCQPFACIFQGPNDSATWSIYSKLLPIPQSNRIFISTSSHS